MLFSEVDLVLPVATETPIQRVLDATSEEVIAIPIRR